MASIYIHWPFCKSKCPYCDFNSHVISGIDESAWKKAYLREIDYYTDYLQGKQIASIFFGGGTPSLMPTEIMAQIIEHLAKYAQFEDDIEISFEANPTSVEAAKFQDFRLAGANRVSLGIQSLNADDLKFLGREHSEDEAIEAIEIASNYFDNYSFDLIYARPNQTLESWEQELRQALKLAAKHLSLYQLTIEKGTPFFKAYKENQFIMPDDDLSASFYELTDDIMEAHNMPAYEISNYAKIGYECKHNLGYWRYQEYLGIGPGAHGRINQSATITHHKPEKWLSCVEKYGHGQMQATNLSQQMMEEEKLIMGIRLQEGVNIKEIGNINENNLIMLINHDYIIKQNEIIRLTKRGRLITNQIILQLKNN